MTPGRRRGHIRGKIATLVKSSVFLKNWYCPEEGTRGKSGRFDAWNLPGKRDGTDVRRLLSALPGPRARLRSGFALGDFAVSVVKGNEPFPSTALSAPLLRCIEKVRFILRFIYLFERKRVSQRAQARGGGSGGGREPDHGGSTPGPWDQHRSRRQTHNRRSHPGAPRNSRGRSPPAELFLVVVSVAPAGSSRATGSRQTPAISRLPFGHLQLHRPTGAQARRPTGPWSWRPWAPVRVGPRLPRATVSRPRRVRRVLPDSESVGFPRGSYASIKRIINRFLCLF